MSCRVIRYLTLAAVLAGRGAQIDFICRTHNDNSIDLIEQQNFHVVALPPMNIAREIAPDFPAHANWLAAIGKPMCSSVVTR